MSRPPPEIARRTAAASVSLKLTEARALLRLCSELHDSAQDPTARKEHLLCRLLAADAGVSVVTHASAPAGATTVVTLARWGMTEADAETFSAHYRATAVGEDSRGENGRRRGGRRNSVRQARNFIPATARVDSRQWSAAEYGPGPAPTGADSAARFPRVSPADLRRVRRAARAAILDLLHSEMAWLYRPDLPLVSPAGMALSPRQRQTLQFLLAGHSEKQIVAHLLLSHNTVHHYVKAIHRHFRVASRSELLARWVRK